MSITHNSCEIKRQETSKRKRKNGFVVVSCSRRALKFKFWILFILGSFVCSLLLLLLLLLFWYLNKMSNKQIMGHELKHVSSSSTSTSSQKWKKMARFRDKISRKKLMLISFRIISKLSFYFKIFVSESSCFFFFFFSICFRGSCSCCFLITNIIWIWCKTHKMRTTTTTTTWKWKQMNIRREQ